MRSQAYDLVLNGWELGSGSRSGSTASDIQRRVFDALGHRRTRRPRRRFGFLLGAFRYGAPPHAGFAVGIDRLVAVFAGEENIREVIAFPKTQSGTDPMTGAPKALADPGVLRASLGLSPSPTRRTEASVVAGDDLFSPGPPTGAPGRRGRPLAARLRPRTLDDIVGQRHLVAPARRCGPSSSPTA